MNPRIPFHEPTIEELPWENRRYATTPEQDPTRLDRWKAPESDLTHRERQTRARDLLAALMDHMIREHRFDMQVLLGKDDHGKDAIRVVFGLEDEDPGQASTRILPIDDFAPLVACVREIMGARDHHIHHEIRFADPDRVPLVQRYSIRPEFKPDETGEFVAKIIFDLHSWHAGGFSFPDPNPIHPEIIEGRFALTEKTEASLHDRDPEHADEILRAICAKAVTLRCFQISIAIRSDGATISCIKDGHDLAPRHEEREPVFYLNQALGDALVPAIQKMAVLNHTETEREQRGSFLLSRLLCPRTPGEKALSIMGQVHYTIRTYKGADRTVYMDNCRIELTETEFIDMSGSTTANDLP